MPDAIRRRALAIVPLLLAVSTADAMAQPETRITIISDAFARDSRLDLDWGFAALIEHGGRRILFDTGNTAATFAANSAALKIDLTRLDFVVISHRHGDHTDGLHHLLTVNPRVPIYVANDEYFGGPTPAAFFARPVPSLPAHMRYFRGAVPTHIPHGTPWRGANLHRVERTVELAPGIRLVPNRAATGAFSETPEVSLVLDTPEGPIVVVGCSHPGIDTILGSVDAGRTGVRLIAGGLHLVGASSDDIARVGAALGSTWRVKAIAPGHCTGETAFAALQQVFGPAYHYAGVGSVLVIRPGSIE